MESYSYHLFGNGNLAAALAAHFAEREMAFTWLKPSEAGRYFTASDEPSKKAVCFFAVSDAALPKIWAQLAGKHKDSIYVHFSASVGTRLGRLLPQTVCLHPMFTFPDKSEVNFENVPFSFQGAAEHLGALRAVFPSSAIIPMTIKTPELYHLLGVFSSNFQIALLAICEKLGKENGLSAADVKVFLLPIMRQTLTNYENADNLFAALSGPVKRGDENTISRHEVALRKADSDLELLYKRLTSELKKISK